MTEKIETHTDVDEKDGWETYSIRVKKDPDYPFHGTEIEFNGYRYIREDKPTSVEVVTVEQFGDAIEEAMFFTSHNKENHPADRYARYIATRYPHGIKIVP